MKKHEKSQSKIKNTIGTIGSGLALVISVCSVVAGGFNFLAAYKLAPVFVRLEKIETAEALNAKKDNDEHPTFVTHDQLNTENAGFNKRLDDLYKLVNDLYQYELRSK